MTKEEKIERIYEVIADKTQSFGCIVYHRWVMCTILSDYKDDERLFVGDTVARDMNIDRTMYTNRIWKDKVQKVKWHPVMLWDLLDYLDKNATDKYSKRKINGKPLFDWTVTRKRNWLHVVVCHHINEMFFRQLYSHREDKRLPIEGQTDRCIDFIYSLVK